MIIKIMGNGTKIIETRERTSVLIQHLLDIWEDSVRATHLFLSDSEIADIKKYVPQAIKGVTHLVVAESENNFPVAFMGIDGRKLEMLFVSSEERGKGIGKALIKYGVDSYAINKLTVNDQNPLAKVFYEHMGFAVYKRTDFDEQGKPYPILYMKRD